MINVFRGEQLTYSLVALTLLFILLLVRIFVKSAYARRGFRYYIRYSMIGIFSITLISGYMLVQVQNNVYAQPYHAYIHKATSSAVCRNFRGTDNTSGIQVPITNDSQGSLCDNESPIDMKCITNGAREVRGVSSIPVPAGKLALEYSDICGTNWADFTPIDGTTLSLSRLWLVSSDGKFVNAKIPDGTDTVTTMLYAPVRTVAACAEFLDKQKNASYACLSQKTFVQDFKAAIPDVKEFTNSLKPGFGEDQTKENKLLQALGFDFTA